MQKNKRRLLIGLPGFILIFIFQNCSNVGFQNGIDTTHTFSSSSKTAVMQIEGGRIATNKHLLNITVIGLNPNTMDQMRIANKKDMNGNQFPASSQWQPFSENFQYDLGDDYASDGSKDDEKTLVMQVKPKITADVQTVDPFYGAIQLDTVPPSLVLSGVLKNGLNGATYTKGQTMTLAWTAADVAASTGNSSGLDPNASIQVTWSDPEDCSKIDQTNLGPLLPDNAATRNFVWPKDSRLENFYICIFAEDRAGNRTTGLSQPMNDIWQVIAGDNNQGNGGSWKASNVRFSYPYAMTVDSKDNLYIYDNDFVNIRKVTTDGTITSYLGNGKIDYNGTVTDQFNSPLPIGTMSIAVDSKDRMYYGSGRIYRFSVDETSHTVKTDYLLAGGVNFTIHTFTDGVEYLLFSSMRLSGSILDHSFIYKVPLSAFDNMTLPATEDSLAAYKIAGNGSMNNYKSTLLPRQQTAATATLPEVRALKVDSNDDIYFAGITDGSGFDEGEHALFLIREGQLYKLTSNNVGPYWTQQLEIITRADGSRYALCAGHYGLMAVKLNFSALPVTADLPIQLLSPTTNISYGAADMSYGVALMHQRINNEPLFYGADQVTSKVLKYQGFTLVDSFGRNTYNSGDNDALTAMINVPNGIAEDPSGNIYVFEALTDVVRKFDSSGHLTLFAGKPFTSTAPSAQVGKTSANALLAGESYASGYKFPMLYDDANSRLVLGLGATGEILYLPTNPSQTVTRLSAAPMAATSITSTDLNKLDGTPDKNMWPVFDMHWLGSQLLVDRVLTVVPYREQLISYSGNTATALLGNELTPSSLDLNGGSNSTYTGAPLSVALASTQPTAILNNQIYLSNAGGILVDNGTNVSQVANITSQFRNFDITTDSAGRKFLIGTQGNDMKAAVIYPDGAAKSFTLCMPGSFTSSSFVKLSRDTNSLLISDTGQRRILRYYLRSNGNVVLFQKPTSGTACVPISL